MLPALVLSSVLAAEPRAGPFAHADGYGTPPDMAKFGQMLLNRDGLLKE